MDFKAFFQKLLSGSNVILLKSARGLTQRIAPDILLNVSKCLIQVSVAGSDRKPRKRARPPRTAFV
jgi:hypothetical protein